MCRRVYNSIINATITIIAKEEFTTRNISVLTIYLIGEPLLSDENYLINEIESSLAEIHTELIENNKMKTNDNNTQPKSNKKVHFNTTIMKQSRAVREICINISRNVEDSKEEEEIAQNTLTSVANLVYVWKNANFIESIKVEGNTKADQTVTNICEQIFDIKVVGSDRRQTHNFITVDTTKGFGKLINR